MAEVSRWTVLLGITFMSLTNEARAYKAGLGDGACIGCKLRGDLTQVSHAETGEC